MNIFNFLSQNKISSGMLNSIEAFVFHLGSNFAEDHDAKDAMIDTVISYLISLKTPAIPKEPSADSEAPNA